MSDGNIFKPDKDYTKDADKILPEAEELAKKDLQKGIDKIIALEKQSRQASDLATTSRCLVAIITLCKQAGDWSLLNEQVLLLSKKHGQLKQAITAMVQEVMKFLDDTPNLDTKLSIIETLRTVTEGRIFVEVERARITRILSDIKKEQGDIKSASEILCELQVETFGSMTRREKTEFILEQVELCMENGDWTQAMILSRKMSTRYFARKPKQTPEQMEKEKKAREEKEKKRSADEPPPEPLDDVTDLKLRYYEQQIKLAKHEDRYLDACKHYRQVLDTESVENNPDQLRATLQRVIYFVLLAPYDNEQSDLLHRVYQDSRNSEVPKDAALLKQFTIHELMRWPMVEQQYGEHLCSTDIFSKTEDSSDPKAHTRYEALRHRVIEHNVRVVAKYYTRITFPRLTELLDLSEEETEKYISDLVTKKTVYARIDRPARMVSFEEKRGPDEVLDEWGSSMKGLLGLLERVGHLMQREEMMARIAPKDERAKVRMA
ncbi:26S proteasome regulatory subunit N5 [Exophiala viscosa]|uniref:26S proteasome regulatory subunit N5 n=1 Tax=Exophiala viscosa TaxID=2486360 RepID=A0AAN6E3F4_9EURO|nr:26S proteasome regulatory subunit N5 [Exophiala viscosa]